MGLCLRFTRKLRVLSCTSAVGVRKGHVLEHSSEARSRCRRTSSGGSSAAFCCNRQIRAAQQRGQPSDSFAWWATSPDQLGTAVFFNASSI